MQFQISKEEVCAYIDIINGNKIEDRHVILVPGNLVVHKVLELLELPRIKSSKATFNKSSYSDELLHLDLFQANRIIEFKVTHGRQLRVSGTFELYE